MSAPGTAARLCEWTHGRLLRGRDDQRFEATVIDSREAKAGCLFVAIVGPNHDAHRFVPEVLAQGAAGVVVCADRIPQELAPGEGFVVAVEDTTLALADLARGHRREFSGPLIGITGSNGKTTTKELCAGVLQTVGPTLSTRGNLNNEFGLPLTLLRRESQDIFAVVEMGMNHRGEIASLAAIAEPTVGVLTNVGTAHIEFLGSREAIAEEKGDLLAALPPDGVAVVGRDDPLAFAQSERTSARVLSFGRSAAADLRASGIRFVDDDAFVFELEAPFGRGEVRVPGLAETIVDNALAAAGGAFAAEVSFDAVVRGLAAHRGVAGRMQPRLLAGDVLVIDDSYNANPQPMRNALETLGRLQTSGRRFAVLGEMGELGDASNEAHHEAGRLAGRIGLEGLFVLGDSAERVAAGAREAGLTPDRIHLETSHEAIAEKLRDRLGKGDLVLIKGSRAARMERVIAGLEADEAGGTERRSR
jgi:UDP-N-acetylmuramoyl-tripeptide--D-alanyl-D-alanine ligase